MTQALLLPQAMADTGPASTRSISSRYSAISDMVSNSRVILGGAILLLSLLAYSATDSKVVTITVQLHELTAEEEELLHELCLLDKYRDMVACTKIQETYRDTYDEGKKEKTND